MKAAVLAAFLAGAIYQVLALFEPLKSTLSAFSLWERVIILGAWCALLSAIAIVAGRQTANYRQWRADICIVVIGLGLGLAHFARGRGHPLPAYPHEYIMGVAEMTVCWTISALVADRLMPNTSLERTRGR